MLYLAALGLTMIIVKGMIMKVFPFSFIKMLIPGNDCCQCTGFWAGIIISLLQIRELQALSYTIVVDTLMFAFCVSFLAYVADNVLEYLDNNTYA